MKAWQEENVEMADERKEKSDLELTPEQAARNAWMYSGSGLGCMTDAVHGPEVETLSKPTPVKPKRGRTQSSKQK